MPRRAHGKPGKFAIYDSEVPGALDNPDAYPSAVYLHSDWEYFKIFHDQTVSLALPARGPPFGVATHTPFAAHNLGYRPFALLRINTKQVPASSLVQGGSSDDFRALSLQLTTTGFVVREVWTCDDGNGTPAITLSLRAIAYGPVAKNWLGYQARFTPGDGRLVLGNGAVDFSQRYLRKVDSGAVDFYATAKRSMDHTRSGLRQVLPDGETISTIGYTGSFTGGPFFGVVD
mgnify:CR=1 FL=1